MAQTLKTAAELKAAGTFRSNRKVAEEIKLEKLDIKKKPPAWMSDQAQEFWKENYSSLVESGSLRADGLHAFISACDAWSDFYVFAELMSRAQKEGTETAELLVIQERKRRARADFLSAAMRVGLTSVDRSKVRIPANTEKKKPLGGLLE